MSAVTPARLWHRRWRPTRRKQTHQGRRSLPGSHLRPRRAHLGSFCPFPAQPWWPLRTGTEVREHPASAHTHLTQIACDTGEGDTRTQLAVSYAHVALQQIVNLLDGLFLKCGRLEGTNTNTPSQGRAALRSTHTGMTDSPAALQWPGLWSGAAAFPCRSPAGLQTLTSTLQTAG